MPSALSMAERVSGGLETPCRKEAPALFRIDSLEKPSGEFRQVGAEALPEISLPIFFCGVGDSTERFKSASCFYFSRARGRPQTAIHFDNLFDHFVC